MAPIVELRAVSKDFPDGRFFPGRARIRAVDHVSLSVEPGETLGIIGESGSGKTTLLQMILRLLRPSGGKIAIFGSDIWALTRTEILDLRRRMQPVFQNPASSLNPRQVVGAILSAPLEVHRIGHRTSRRERVAEMLERIGLPRSMAGRYPHELSGGQKQLVALGRALILNPAILVADEPTSSLDSISQARLLDVIRTMKLDLGFTTILASHDVAVIQKISDRVAVMNEGAFYK